MASPLSLRNVLRYWGVGVALLLSVFCFGYPTRAPETGLGGRATTLDVLYKGRVSSHFLDKER
jgi:hypothetical protein